MRGSQVFKTVALPVHALSFGAKNHTVGDFFSLYTDPAWTVALYRLNVKIVWF